MVKTLIKKQLLELFQTYFVDRKTGKARSKKGTVFFFVLLGGLFLCLGLTFYSMASGLGGQVLGFDLNWLYFALMGLLAIALGVFGSVFNTYASLYIPKDNDFLLSLPIPPAKLLFSRVAGVYITSFMYCAWVWIPTLIAYWVTIPVTALNVAFPVILTFILSLLVSVLSCALGWVVALVATKAKGKSIITVILSLSVLIGYYVVYFKIVGSIDTILSRLGEIGSQIKTKVYFVYLMGSAADGDVVSMLVFSAIVIAVFAVCMFILSKTFMRIVISNPGSSKKSAVKGDYRQKSLNKALLNRELKHFTSVSTWMLNGGLGLLILPALGIAAIIKRETLLNVISQISVGWPEISIAIPAFLVCGICMCISTNTILPVSISIEGKSMWIAQSLPVNAWDLLHSKEKMSVLLNIFPVLFAVGSLSFVCNLKPYEIIPAVIAVLIYILLSADFGLFLNLKSPNFNWTNEATLTKQSMPVMVSLFGGWIFSALLGFAGYWLSNFADAYLIISAYCVLFAVLTVILRRWLKSRGTRIFSEL